MKFSETSADYISYSEVRKFPIFQKKGKKIQSWREEGWRGQEAMIKSMAQHSSSFFLLPYLIYNKTEKNGFVIINW